ncbi:peroxiredoxin, Ohr subfamily [compost metagenome]
MGVVLPADTRVDTEIDLCNTAGNYDGQFYIQARMKVDLPGLDRLVAQRVMDEAHRTCPYNEAMKGNVDPEIELH